MRRIKTLTQAIAFSALTLAATSCATSDHAEPPPAAQAPVADKADKVVLGDGRDRTASQTAEDWATYADHVLVVTVLSEIPGTPSRKEQERGEGMIGRTVKLRVDRVLWSAPDAPHPAPTTLDLSAAGWVFNNNNGTGTVKFALADSSRLEKGHTYIKAFEWVDDPCSDNPKQGTWEALGSGDTIPFDEGVLGAGEFEGRVNTVAELKARWQAEPAVMHGVRHQAAGGTVDALVASLKAAAPRAETGYVPTECDTSDR